MALPTHSKTYLFEVNRALISPGTSLEMHQDAMLYMKNTMKGWASNPWTVTQSCYRVSEVPEIWDIGPGDRWGGPGGLIWGNPNFSWIVLQAPVGSMQILIVLNLSPSDIVMHVSPGGLYTVGTGPNVAGWPTATDELNIYGFGFGAQPTHGWLHARNFVYPGQIHMFHSTDGEVSGFMCCANGMLSGVWIFYKNAEPLEGWSIPYSFLTLDCMDSRDSLTYVDGLCSGGSSVDKWSIAGNPGGYSFRHGQCTEGIDAPGGVAQNLPIGQTWAGANALSGEYPMTPLYSAGYLMIDALGAESLNVGARQLLGRVPDIYATGTGLSTGDTLEANPGTPTREWAVMGNTVIPWNGSVPVVL